MVIGIEDKKKELVHAVFLGSKNLGLSVFKALFESTDYIKWTIIHPDDTNDSRSALCDWQFLAKSLELELLVSNTRTNTKNILRRLKPDIGFVCGWYSLFDSETLTYVKSGLWGLHNSLLPKYRGSSPLVWSIIEGDQIIGCSIFKISEGLDDGEILFQIQITNSLDDTISTLLSKIEQKIILLLPDKWRSLIEDNYLLTVQNENESTFCGPRIEADGLIDWSRNSLAVHNFIRAQSPPYPCAYTYHQDSKIQVLSSKICNVNFYGTPGQILKRNLNSVLVSCGSNTSIEIYQIRVDGIDYNAVDYLKSHKIRFRNFPKLD